MTERGLRGPEGVGRAGSGCPSHLPGWLFHKSALFQARVYQNSEQVQSPILLKSLGEIVNDMNPKYV
jgi:hypothetical protein